MHRRCSRNRTPQPMLRPLPWLRRWKWPWAAQTTDLRPSSLKRYRGRRRSSKRPRPPKRRKTAAKATASDTRVSSGVSPLPAGKTKVSPQAEARAPSLTALQATATAHLPTALQANASANPPTAPQATATVTPRTCMPRPLLSRTSRPFFFLYW